MINFYKFPASGENGDKLEHTQVIQDNIDNIKNKLKKDKSTKDAKELEVLLNKVMYFKGVEPGKEQYYQEYRAAVEQEVNNYLQKLYGGNTSIIMDLEAKGLIGNIQTDNPVIGKHGKQVNAIEKNLKAIGDALKSNQKGLPESEIEKIKANAQSLLNILETLKAQVKTGGRITPKKNQDFVDDYNKLMNRVFSNGFLNKLGTAGEAFVAALQLLAQGKGLEDLEKVIDSSVIGGNRSSATISGEGLKEIMEAENILLKGWDWGEDGGLKCQTLSQDKVDVIFKLGNVDQHYISSKNYLKGATENLHLSGQTHLASLLSSSAIIEPFSRAYMRFLGWKPGKWEFKEESEIVNTAKNSILLLAISGLGFQEKTVDILTINNRQDGYWKCYSLEDIADKLLVSNKSYGSYGGLPKTQGALHDNFYSKFLHLKITAQVTNLENLMK